VGSDNKEGRQLQERKRLSNSTTTVTIDANLLSALIAAAVALVVLLLDKLVIEPRKWKKRYEIRSLEKTLEVYGALVTILKTCHTRALMQNAPSTAQYTVNLNEISQLEVIFERKRYLLSEQLCTQWENLEKYEPQLGELKTGAISDLNLPLKEMRGVAEREFAGYTKRYEELTGFEPPTSYQSGEPPI
jgi:hypothetical protein